MERAVFYARVSTAEEEQANALVKQVQENKDIIASKGWELIDGYVDEGKSGTKIKGRNEYQRLLADMDGDKFDIIVIKSQDRLQRNTKDWYVFADHLNKSGKRLFLYMDNKFYEPSDDALITGIKAILAEEYSRDLSKKLNNSNQRRIEKARKGERISAMGNGSTYGYKIVDGKWVIEEEQAEIVRKMFNLYLELHSMRKVRDTMNELGYRNQRGKLFTEDSIRGVLKNEKHKGWVVVNRDHRDFETKRIVTNPKEEWVYVKGDHEPIVSEKIWDKVNDEISSHVNTETGRGKKTGDDIFSGKLCCSSCGSTLWKHQANGYYSWYCPSKMGRGKMSCKDPVTISTMAVQKILSEVTDVLLSFEVVELSKARVKRQALKWLSDLKSSLMTTNDNDKIQATIEKLERKRDKLTEVFLEEIIAKADYKAKYSDLEQKIEEQRKLIVPIEENDDILAIEETIQNIDKEVEDLLKDYADEEETKANFLLEHIKNITVFKNKEVAIEFDLFAGALLVADGGMLLQVPEEGSSDFVLVDRESMSKPNG